MSKRYLGHSVRLLQEANSPVIPVTDLSTPPNISTESDETGAARPLTRHVTSTYPQIVGATKSIDRFLRAVPYDGACVRPVADDPQSTILGLEAYYRRNKTCKGDVVTANSHLLRSMTRALLYPTRLSSGGRDQTIRLAFEADGYKKDANRSIGGQDGVPLPTVTDADLYYYVFAGVRVGGLWLGDSLSFDLEFGNQKLEQRPELGGVEPDDAAIGRSEPAVTITGEDLSRFKETSDGIGLDGLAVDHANTELWFKRRKGRRGAIEADDAPVHGKLTLAGLATWQELGAGSGSSEATNGLLIETVDDGVNLPLPFTWGLPYQPGT